MNHSSNLSHIKRSQKESLLLRELSKMLLQLSLDDAELNGLFINRVELSPKRSACYVFFYTNEGETFYRENLGKLILFKPSLRAALAKEMNNRYTPEIIFKYDKSEEKD